MARRRKAPEPENHERWLVSYADFITLLFAFFVVMFASSQTDKVRAARVSESVVEALEGMGASGVAAKVASVLGGTVGDTGRGNAMMKGPGGAQRAAENAPPEEVVELIPSLNMLSAELQNEIAEGKLEVSLEPKGLVVSLRQAAFFPSGEDIIADDADPVIAKVAKALKTTANPIRLEGHTDARPIHTARFPSNWELSTARSIAMMHALTDQFGVAPHRISVAGFADTVPTDTNDTEEGRARNRRVDIVILNQLGLRYNTTSVSADVIEAAEQAEAGEHSHE